MVSQRRGNNDVSSARKPGAVAAARIAPFAASASQVGAASPAVRGEDHRVGTGHPRRRRRAVRRPWYVRELSFVLVSTIVVLGLAAVSLDYWRRGLLWAGAGLFVAAAIRLLVPTRKVGLLAVRGRPFDVCAYLALAAAVVGCTLAVPLPGAGS